MRKDKGKATSTDDDGKDKDSDEDMVDPDDDKVDPDQVMAGPDDDAEPPVAAMIIHELLVVAKVSSYIHSGNCPSSWATSQHPTFGSTQRYEPATLLAITQCHCCHHLASV